MLRPRPRIVSFEIKRIWLMVSTTHFKHGTLDSVTFSNLPSIRLTKKFAYPEKLLKKAHKQTAQAPLGLYNWWATFNQQKDFVFVNNSKLADADRRSNPRSQWQPHMVCPVSWHAIAVWWQCLPGLTTTAVGEIVLEPTLERRRLT